ncbi:MAG: AAA family ATPase [Clostridia bacterium]|nr:AAA family ATPase [Clostridia bacterium]
MSYVRSVFLSEELDSRSYLAKIPAVTALMRGERIPLDAPVTVFVGENGTGKSTLIEAIAVAYGFNPEGGTKNSNFSTEQSHSELWKHLTLVKGKRARDGFFLRAESFYNFASNLDQLDRQPAASPLLIKSYGGVSLHQQSHGESFLRLVQYRFSGGGLYILDEPEAALSPMRLLTLLAEIDQLVKADSQFIIATHSPILMAYPGARVLELSEDGIRQVDYRETEHFRCSKDFYTDPDRMIHYLLK